MKYLFLFLFAVPVFAQQPTQYLYKITADTSVIQPSLTVLDAIVIGAFGTTDTIQVWDTNLKASLSSSNLVLTIPAVTINNRVISFGPYGLWLKTGLCIGVHGTAGKYTFIYR